MNTAPASLPTVCVCRLFLILRLLWSVPGVWENLQAPQKLWKPLIKSYCQHRQTQFTSFPRPSFVLHFCSNFANTVCRLVWPSCQPGSPWPMCCPAWQRWGEVFCELCRFLVCCCSAQAGPGPADWGSEEILWQLKGKPKKSASAHYSHSQDLATWPAGWGQAVVLSGSLSYGQSNDISLLKSIMAKISGRWGVGCAVWGWDARKLQADSVLFNVTPLPPVLHRGDLPSIILVGGLHSARDLWAWGQLPPLGAGLTAFPTTLMWAVSC